MNTVRVCSNIGEFDYAFIYTKLSTTYWANKRTLAIVKKSFQNSLSKMVYVDDKPVGFGRVVTDYATFGYLADIFISEEYRGRGLAKTLIDSLMHDEKLSEISKWVLITLDAHKLYTPFGFNQPEFPERYMEYFP